MVKFFLKIIIGLLICCHAYGENQPLSIDQAFAFSAHFEPNNTLILEWNIAPDYHLYKDKMSVSLQPGTQIHIGRVELPPAQIKKDKMLGPLQIYSGAIKIPVSFAGPFAKEVLHVIVHYQGCSDKGFCYPPETRFLRIQWTPNKTIQDVLITHVLNSGSPQQTVENKLLNGSNLLMAVISFLGVGLLLSFTPCVLPMVPILSGIIVGHGKRISTFKAFFLSLSYVLGMAVTYAIAGVIVAMIGEHIQILFQTTWVIVLFSGFFVVLAFSLFGFFEVETPGHWRKRVTAWSHQHKAGTYFGVFMMGALSSLILSPCVSAPLVGVLAYIAQSGNVLLGGISLLSLGVGMGIPLLLIGTSAGKLLPKSGHWMLAIKKIFGVIMLGMTIWMLSRVIPGPVTLFLWAVLLICVAIFMDTLKRAKSPWHNLKRGLGVVLLMYGVVLMIGAALGNSDPLYPWQGTKIEVTKKSLGFITVNNMDDFDKRLAEAKMGHKLVMLDFYADWCTACHAMEHFVFSHSSVQDELAGFIVLRVDVTHNTPFDQAILKRFNVVAPPTILFFNANGEELGADRIIGEVNARDFVSHVMKIE